MVIFSAGRDNRVGHPHPAVVARYRAAGAAMFSTAEDGAVILETSGGAVRVWSWRRGRASFDASAAMAGDAGGGGVNR